VLAQVPEAAEHRGEAEPGAAGEPGGQVGDLPGGQEIRAGAEHAQHRGGRCAVTNPVNYAGHLHRLLADDREERLQIVRVRPHRVRPGPTGGNSENSSTSR
jgi:hypothetical protein